MTQPPGERPSVKSCHICDGTRIYYLFSVADYRVVRCEDCGLVFLNPQPSDEELTRICAGNHVPTPAPRHTELYLSELRRYHGLGTGRLVEIGCGRGDFLAAAEQAGWLVTGVEQSTAAGESAKSRLKRGTVFCGSLAQADLPAEQFDLCVVSSVLEYVRSPRDFLRAAHR